MQTPTIYLIDDDPEVLRATQRLLASDGMVVAAFPSARHFLESYDYRSSGCLVLDVTMPGLGGLELQRTLVEHGAPLSVVFLTGQSDIGASAQAMKDGAVAFLTKPVDDVDLLAAVNQALAKTAVLQHERTARVHTRGDA